MFLLVLVVGLCDVVALIPMAALVAVMMIIVAVATFDGRSIRPATLKRMPISETVVMLVTVAVVATHNLAIGVIVGVIAAMIRAQRREHPHAQAASRRNRARK